MVGPWLPRRPTIKPRVSVVVRETILKSMMPHAAANSTLETRELFHWRVQLGRPTANQGPLGTRCRPLYAYTYTMLKNSVRGSLCLADILIRWPRDVIRGRRTHPYQPFFLQVRSSGSTRMSSSFRLSWSDMFFLCNTAPYSNWSRAFRRRALGCLNLCHAEPNVAG
jgi:hypothetical protein